MDLKEVLFCLLFLLRLITFMQAFSGVCKNKMQKKHFFLFNPVVPSRLIVLIMKDNKESK